MAVLRSSAVLCFTFTLLLSSSVLTAQVPDRGTPVEVPNGRPVGTDASERAGTVTGAAAAGETQACCFSGGGCEMLDPVSCENQFVSHARGLPRGLGSVCGQDAGPDGIDSTCADLPRVSLVPVATGRFGALAPGASIDGNEIILVTDGITTQIVVLEVRISDWDPDDVGVLLRGYESAIDTSGFSSGTAGMLVPTVAPCQVDRDCLQAFGGVCEVTNGPCFASGIGGGCPSPSINPCGGSQCRVDPDSGTNCEALFTLAFRNDFVLASGGMSVSAANQMNLEVGGATFNDGADDPDPFPAEGLYAATLVVDVGPDVRGTFTVGLRDGETDTILIDQDIGFLPILPPGSAKITVAVGGACCDELAGICSLRPEANCTGPGLRYGGDGTDCDSLAPACSARVGACCDPNTASCSLMTEAECAGPGFRFTAVGTDCTSITPSCTVPTVTGWGLAILALSLLTLSKLRFRDSPLATRRARLALPSEPPALGTRVPCASSESETLW